MKMARLLSARYGVILPVAIFAAILCFFSLSETSLFSRPAASTLQKAPSVITVTSNADSGPGTLRQAILDATDGEMINFDTLQVGNTITLTSGQIALDKNVTIQGPGAGALTIQRSAAQGTPLFRIFMSFGDNRIVHITGLTIANGSVNEDFGGGIANFGDLTLNDVVLANNTNTGVSSAFGGGVFNAGSLTVIDSTFKDNSARAGGGIASSGSMTLDNVTISDNTAYTGAGLFLERSEATMTNCTVSGNQSLPNLGAIFNSSGQFVSSLTLINCTVANNEGNGIITSSDGDHATTMLRNCLLHTSVGENSFVIGPLAHVVSFGHNLDTDGSTGFFNGVNGDIVGTFTDRIDPRIGPLGDNGGKTFTHTLLAGSLAIDRGTTTGAPGLDQRGLPRSIDGDNNSLPAIDIGAFEVQKYIVTTTQGDEATAGSLPNAIFNNNVAGGGLIVFNLSPDPETIILASELALMKDVRILGPGQDLLALDGNGANRIFNISSGVIADIHDLAITNGQASSGGGILNSGRLFLFNCAVFNNTAEINGGGISNNGDIDIYLCVVAGNTANGGNTGGGGIWNSGSLILQECSLLDNHAPSPAGGFGGGIFNFRAQGSSLIKQSLINGNTAFHGGGIHNEASSMVLENVTISVNTVFGGGGGGIHNIGFTGDSSTVSLINCTIADNAAGGDGGAGVRTWGVGNPLSVTTRIKNTLVASNIGFNFSTLGTNGALISNGNNLDSDGTSGFIDGQDGNIVGSSVRIIDAKLGLAGENGGTTATYPLLPGSPAIDAGSNIDAPQSDQRGFFRHVGANVDIGAYEVPTLPVIQAFSASAGMGQIQVQIPVGWTASVESGQSFITLTSGGGVGNGTVTYTIAANTAPAPRSGTLLIAWQPVSVVQGAAFNDVPVSHPFYTEIGKLSARGITLGCDAANYCPDLTVTRQQMAAFIIRALGDFNPPPPAMQRFSDVPPANPFYSFIEQMALRQITLGCSANMYCPTDPVLRDQMAAFIIRALHPPGYVPPTPAMQRFPDVPPTNAFYAHIEEMAVRQITLGCGGGNYCPSLEVSRGQMAAFLVRAFNL